MVANLKYIFQSLAINLKKEAQYKTSFALKIVMMMLNNAFFVLEWLIIFGFVDSIGGYTLKEVMLLWAVSAGGYGVAHLFFNGVFGLDDLIYNGKLDVFMVQPKNVLLNVACSKTDASAIGDALYAFVALAIGGATWWQYFAVIPFIICSGILYASFIALVSCLGFYIKRGAAVGDVITLGMTSFSNMPPTIFSTAIKAVLYTLIPAGFFTFVPVYIMLSFKWWLLVAYAGFTALITILAFVCFKIGLKKYSSGGLGGARV